MHIDMLTLFPEMMEGMFKSSILQKANERGSYTYRFVNFRDYSTNKHGKVDDYPYGGGAGMVLTPQPIFDAVESVSKNIESKPRIILMSPQGEVYNQTKAAELAREEHLIFICGHYEGYDERIRKALATDEISIGDYVLTGGELGAMVVIDSVVRLLPDVLGNNQSAQKDSFSAGLLEHPHYTRPATFRGLNVPNVLLSGNHGHIDRWRKKESLKRTYLRRKDLLLDVDLSKEEQEMLKEIQDEHE
ncbi:MAG TPA: tRNA (guanosine(37)-N1)-methyltransferase TrmD [Bacillota bacterium]|nr:tRNA (guanosine(37)-N1)-methyltransferase TrmD [Bacillota bacterium]